MDQASDDHLNTGAGDQGLMFGYACDETPSLMPFPIYYAHRLVQRQSEVRRDGRLPWLRPDAKSQLTVRYAGGRPKKNAWRSLEEVPAETAESREMSRELRRRGFRFVGPTICYAFMQAVGMVNDHLVGCFRHRQVGR